MDFKINLIKDRVPSFEKRKLIFSAINLYLAFCGVVIVLLCYLITVNFVNMNNFKKRIAFLESKVYTSRFEEKNIFDEAMKTKANIVRYASVLESVDEVLSKRIDLISFFLRFSVALPQDAYIDNFNFNRSSGKLSFNVVVPAGGLQDSFDTSELISSWKKDPFLTLHIGHIESSATKRQKRKEELIFVSEFFCSLNI